MKILQYRDFAIDRRTSMDIYADQLYGALQSAAADLDVAQFAPKPWLASDAEQIWRMRFDRYVSYPQQVRCKSATVHHVLDHGYAHLVNAIRKGFTICTVHDLIPFLRWIGKIPTIPTPGEKLHRPGKKPTLNIYSLEQLPEFDRVIAPSANTRRDLIEHFGLEEDRVSVVPMGVQPIFRPLAREFVDKFRKQYGWPDRDAVKRVLITGMEFYKNHEMALEVFKEVRRLADVEVRLVRSGHQSTNFDNWVARHGLRRVVDTVYVARHADMALLYNAVDCLLFPSLYEGFGMPVVEALACGTPVVTSNVASLPEITTDFVFTHDPADRDGMVASVNAALFDPAIIAEFKTRGPAWSSQFLWSSVAEQTAQLYRDILQG